MEINIEELTVKQLQELVRLAAPLIGASCAVPTSSADTLVEVGEAYFIRTVTCYYTGRVVRIGANGDLMLADAAWIPDTGRFGEALRKEEFAEVEPYPSGTIVKHGVIVDMCKIKKLPSKVKP